MIEYRWFLFLFLFSIFMQGNLLTSLRRKTVFSQDQKSIDAAISTQQTATYGDFRSPIRANFQNVPSALEETVQMSLSCIQTIREFVTG